MRARSPSDRRRLHYAIVEPETLSKNELRFLISQGLTPIAIPLAEAVEILTRRGLNSFT